MAAGKVILLPRRDIWDDVMKALGRLDVPDDFLYNRDPPSRDRDPLSDSETSYDGQATDGDMRWENILTASREGLKKPLSMPKVKILASDTGLELRLQKCQAKAPRLHWMKLPQETLKDLIP